jgi:HK97 family phage major capsid protein
MCYEGTLRALAMYFAELFAKSFARSWGKSFLSSLLAVLTAGVTTTSTSAIAASEIFTLMDSIDTAYFIKGGFLMNAKTLLAVRQITISGGGALAFPHATEEGRPTILGKPVFLCPNMDDIVAGKVPIVFGALERHAIRAVTDSYAMFRYDEKFMPNHQKAVQSFWRADSLLLTGSATDCPMKTLVMHS